MALLGKVGSISHTAEDWYSEQVAGGMGGRATGCYVNAGYVSVQNVRKPRGASHRRP